MSETDQDQTVERLDKLVKQSRPMEFIRGLGELLEIIFGLAVIAVIIAIVTIWIILPDVPEIAGTNPDLESSTVSSCLYNINRNYKRDFLTVQGQIKGYYLLQRSKWGSDLSDEDVAYHLQYEEFKATVDSFVIKSDTTMLTMKMSPTEFKAALGVLTKDVP